MGRPSKQKVIVDKYFLKNLQHTGKSENRICIFCKGSYAYNAFRLAKHLLVCPKTDDDFKRVKEQISKLFKSRSTEQRQPSQSNSRNVSTASSSILGPVVPTFLSKDNVEEMELAIENEDLLIDQNSLTHQTSVRSTSTYPTQCTLDGYIDRIVNVQEQDEIWKLIARACYASGTPLNFTENIYWQETFKKIRPSLELPTRYHLSSPLLEAEHERVESLVLQKIHNAKYLSLQLDGWSNIRQEPIVNVILTTPEPVIYKIIDTTDNAHTGEYMASIVEDVFNSICIDKIISVVSDNAKNMTKSWKILSDKYSDKYISYYGCAAHVLNLLNKDIMQLKTYNLLGNAAKKVCVEFKQSHILNSLLKQNQNAETDLSKKKLTLKLPIVTRWGSNVQCFRSLLLNKQYLQQVAINPKATKYLSKDSSTKILDNDIFWPKIESILKMLEPVSLWITKLESEKSNLSDVISAFYEIKEAFKLSVPASPGLKAEENSIMMNLEKRREMAIGNIHLACNLLDPRFKGKHLTKEESISASHFIYLLSKRIKIDETEIMSDLAEYRTNTGLWSHDFVWDCLKKRANGTVIDPIIWWNGICSSSCLASVANAILQCPPTSASTERSFSTYGLVHTAKRNRLTNIRASKLVYIKHNLKLQNNQKDDGDDANKYEALNHTTTLDGNFSEVEVENTSNEIEELQIDNEIEYYDSDIESINVIEETEKEKTE